MKSTPQEIRMYAPERKVEDDEIDLADLLGVLIDNRWWIAAIAALFMLFGLTYAYVATPIYKADAMIQVEEKKAGLGDLDINALFEVDATVSAEIELLRSRMVLGTVVDNLGLEILAEPKYFPVFGAALARRAPADERPVISVDTLDVPDSLIGESLTLIAGRDGAYEVLAPDGERILTGRVGEPGRTLFRGDTVSLFVSELRAGENHEFRIARQSKLKAIEGLKESLGISEKGKSSGILTITLEGADPTQLAREVNEIANVYVRQNVERKSAEAEKTLAFLERQLPIIKQDMELAESALNSYRLEKGSVDLPLETQAILESIVTIDGQLNGLQQERDKVLQGFTTAHPVVVALDKQIERLNGELARLNRQVRELPNTQQEILRLVRDAEVNTVLYTSLLNTAQELRVVKAGTVGNVRIVDRAVAPYRPVKPKKALIVMLSLMLGGFVGVMFAVVRRAFNGGVEDPELIEKQVNVPVYATIAHSKNQDRIYRRLKAKEGKRAILANKNPDDIAIESLRNLRTSLHFGMMDAKNNCIMIAGPSPSVGKSFVSVNLAAVLASNNKKVLLIDGDMRRGHLHEYLGIERGDGLSEFISGDIPIGKVLHATTVPGLSFIPTGKIPPNPAELLLHKRFANCLNVLAERFDHVIIDSPPILAVTDATIIGQMAGAVLMVLKSGQHHMREIEQGVKVLRQSGINLRGIIVNDMKLHSKRYGAARYTYQYSYGDTN